MPRRREDALLRENAPRAAVEIGREHAEDREAWIAVMEMLSGGESLHQTACRVAGEDADIVGKAGGMRQQVMDRDRAVFSDDGEVGQVVENRRMQIELAFLMQLQDDERDEGFGDGADLKQMVGRNGEPLIEVGVAVTGNAPGCVGVGKAERKPGAFIAGI